MELKDLKILNYERKEINMNSIINLLKWLNDNWASIVTIVVLVVGIYFKVKSLYLKYKTMTEEEKQVEFDKAVEQAKEALKEVIISYVSDAEINWREENGKLGKTKRAEVIARIYAEYPILVEVVDQEKLLQYIDSLINEALKVVRETIRAAE